MFLANSKFRNGNKNLSWRHRHVFVFENYGDHYLGVNQGFLFLYIGDKNTSSMSKSCDRKIDGSSHVVWVIPILRQPLSKRTSFHSVLIIIIPPNNNFYISNINETIHLQICKPLPQSSATCRPGNIAREEKKWLEWFSSNSILSHFMNFQDSSFDAWINLRFHVISVAKMMRMTKMTKSLSSRSCSDAASCKLNG